MIGWVAPALAGAFEVADQGASAAGTGHASTARRDDAVQAWFNPAALADGGGWRFAAGAALASSRVRATTDDWTTATVTPLGLPPHLYASFAHRGLVAGVAVNTPFAGGVRWPLDGPLRFASLASEPRFVRSAPFVGGRLGIVQLAVGVHVDVGQLYLAQATDHVAAEGLAQVALRGAGVGADASVFVAPSEAVAVGLSYKGRARMTLTGEADFDVPATFASALADGRAAASFTLPDRFALGVAVTGGGARLLVDLGLTAWSVNDVLAIELDGAGDLVRVNDWRDAAVVRAGVEAWRGRWTARAGAYVDGLPGPPVPATTLAPSSPDGARVGGTAGGGAAFGAVRVDAFGEVLRILPRASTSPDAPLATYSGWAAVGGLTLSASLGDRDRAGGERAGEGHGVGAGRLRE